MSAFIIGPLVNDISVLWLGKKKDKGFTIVDSNLFLYLNQWQWSLHKMSGYAYRMYLPDLDGKRKQIWLHLLISEIYGMRKPNSEIDHKNGLRLDNRRCNLRSVTNEQQAINRGRKKTAISRFKGVSWHKRLNRWQSAIGSYRKGTRKHLGTFDSEVDAAIAFNKAAEKLHGKFARLNDIS